MIIISRALTLSAVPTLNANDPIIGYHNLVTITNVVADTEEAEHPAVNLANPATYNKWQAEDTTEQHLTIASNYNDAIDYVAFVRHNFGSIRAPITIQAQYEVAGAWSDVVQESMLADDRPVIFRFTPQSVLDIRAKIGVGTAVAEAAVMYVGKLLILPRRIYVGHAPLPLSRQRTTVSPRSESGQYLGRIVTGETAGGSVNMQHLDPLWTRSYLLPFFNAAANVPFFFAWRPGKYSREVAYCWFTSDPKPSNQLGNGMMQADMALGAIVT